MGTHSDMPLKRTLIFASLASFSLLAGCSVAPLRRSEMREPELLAIHAAFERAVDTADQNPELNWHSGWMGNILVNLVGGDNQGLCYHWQEWTYQTVSPAVRETGWDVCGIAINVGWSGEHHAVLVWDPRRVARPDLLLEENAAASYVLDPWRRGSADIYRLEEWLTLPLVIHAPAEIEDLSELEAVDPAGPSEVKNGASLGQNPDCER
jgi:hypothetical protein